VVDAVSAARLTRRRYAVVIVWLTIGALLAVTDITAAVLDATRWPTWAPLALITASVVWLAGATFLLLLGEI
jgi:hypothetical protein